MQNDAAWLRRTHGACGPTSRGMSPLAGPRFPLSDHCDGRRFFNPGVDTDRGLRDMIRWRRTSTPSPWPAARRNTAYPAPPRPADLADGVIALTFVGQATFLITTAQGTILTDPVFSDRVSPLRSLGPRRVRPPGLALDALPPIDLVLISHNHYDHMDLASLRAIVARPPAPPRIVTGLGNARTLARSGVAGAEELDWWDATQPLPGLPVVFVPAQHWSSRSGFDRRRTLWGGFLVSIGPRRLYFAGDSGYCGWFSTIRERCGPPDLALLPIGAYEPRWFMRSQHMNPAEAVQAHRDLGARHSVGMHFGTVQLTDEPIDEPLHALARARSDAGVSETAFTTLDFGETRLFGAG